MFHWYSVDAESLQCDGAPKLGFFKKALGKVVMYLSPLESSDIPSTSFVHNLMFTDDFLITYQCSVEFDPQAMLYGGSFFRTKPDKTLRFGIVPKNTTDIQWIDTEEAGAIVHPLNSWQEDDGTIVIWTPFCSNLVLDLESESINEFRMVEYRLDPNAGKVLSKRLIDDRVNVEFSVTPTSGRFTKYGYTAMNSCFSINPFAWTRKYWSSQPISDRAIYF